MTHPSAASPASVESLLRAYRQMRTIREFEERLHVEIQTGEIPGFTHLYSGQEANETLVATARSTSVVSATSCARRVTA